MNNLQDLNTEGDTDFSFTDTRSNNVIWYIGTPSNTSITIDENQPHDLYLGGLRINEIIGSSSTGLTVVVDLSHIPGSHSISITNIPSGVTVTESPANHFAITGINKVQDFVHIANNTVVQIGFGTDGVYSYTPQLSYNTASGVVTKSWTVDLTINAVTYLTTPPNYSFIAGGTRAFTSLDIIDNTGVFDPTWTLTLTPSTTSAYSSMSSSYVSGGTQSFNPTTKVMTLTGDTGEMNSLLDGLSIDFESYELDFTIDYYLTNDLNSDVDTKTQNLTSTTTGVFQDRDYLSNQPNFVYAGAVGDFEDAIDVSSTYVIKLTATDGELSYPTTTGDPSTYVTSATSIEFSGIYSALIAKLPEVKYYPDKNFTSNTSITFSLYENSVAPANLLISGDFAVNYAGAGTIGTVVYALNQNTGGPATNQISAPYGTYGATYQDWTPTTEQIKYCVMDILIVGAPGLDGGGDGGGGAGGGEIINLTNQTILNQTYTCKLPHSGTDYHTEFSGYTARNGNNGGNGYSTGATGGSNDLYSGGAGITITAEGLPATSNRTTIAGGGGAGAAGAGQAATSVDDDANGVANYVRGGTGGAGYYSSITGYGRYYGAGAGGQGYKTISSIQYGIGGEWAHLTTDLAWTYEGHVNLGNNVASNFTGSQGYICSGSAGGTGGVIIQVKV